MKLENETRNDGFVLVRRIPLFGARVTLQRSWRKKKLVFLWIMHMRISKLAFGSWIYTLVVQMIPIRTLWRLLLLSYMYALANLQIPSSSVKFVHSFFRWHHAICIRWQISWYLPANFSTFACAAFDFAQVQKQILLWAKFAVRKICMGVLLLASARVSHYQCMQCWHLESFLPESLSLI